MKLVPRNIAAYEYYLNLENQRFPNKEILNLVSQLHLVFLHYMGIGEWFLLLVIVVYAYKVYQRQDYFLDRQVAKFIRFIKSLFH